MKPRALLFIAALGSLALLVRGQAPEPTPTPLAGKGFDAFTLIRTRHVFDPNRRAMRVESTTETRSSRNTRPSYFMLTGTMMTDGKTLAFFSGSRSEFSKVIPAGESVAGYKVLMITPSQVELEHAGKSMIMGVGHRLQLEGMTDEVPASEITPTPAPKPGSPPPAGVIPSPESPSSSNPPVAPAGAAPAPGGDKAEILRRMMERRQKEMSK